MGNRKQIAPMIDLDEVNVTNYEGLIDHVEKTIYANKLNIELPLTHTLTPGLYSREIFIPKGAVLTSKVHKEPHQFLLLKGTMIIVNEEGAFKVTAPFHGTTMPSSTRIGIALEDSIWTTFHNCNLVKDKDYTEEELNELIPQIEDALVDNRTLNKNTQPICHS